MAIQARQRQLVCILGMHRSGTSCLAGCLASAGLYLGDTPVQGSPANPKGNFEHRPIVIFHENTLKALGGSWRSPPAVVTWQAHQRERALSLLDAFPADRLCGFKDPRTLLHLTEWEAYAPAMQYVGIFRHPLGCAHSLQRRDDMALETALALWEHYNCHLLDAWQRQPFPLLDFDAPAPTLLAGIQQAAMALGLRDSIDQGFFNASLRHDPPPASTALTPAIQALFSGLQQAAHSWPDSVASN